MREPAEQDIVLRRAAMTDAERLYRWRTDPETRAASLNTGPVEFESHCTWLGNALDDPNRQIYIAEYRGEPIGTVRADKVDSGWRLSWTVAPEFRERGLGIQMVRLLAASIGGPIEAVIKPGNAASITIAESLGMRFDKEEDGILRFFRGPRTAGCAASSSAEPIVPEPLAIDGGGPVRPQMLRYAGQSVDDDDIRAVEAVLRGDWLTTGPAVAEFERGLCNLTGARFAVAVNTGTAALHAAAVAAGIGPGTEVIVPALSFVASANCVLYCGGRPVFADVCRDTLTIDPADVERRITPQTRAVVAVDFAGHPCDYDALGALAERHGFRLIQDAAHSLGATYHGKQIGALGNLTTLSFHPVKHITTGEGGAVLTDDPAEAKMARSLRHHGIDLDLHARNQGSSWVYDVVSLGYNYRIPDINCALGTSQLKKLDGWLARRRQLVADYRRALAGLPMLELPAECDGQESAWHLYVVRLQLDRLGVSRAQVFAALRAENIGVNVHYIPIPWMTHYARLGFQRGQWPVAEGEYERLLSLPLFPAMTDQDQSDVVTALHKVWHAYGR